MAVRWLMEEGDYICKQRECDYILINPGSVPPGQDASVAYRKILGRAKRDGHLSPSMETALLQLQDSDDSDDGPYDPRMGCAKYYRMQSNQSLGQQVDRVPVPVFVDEKLHISWIIAVHVATRDINEAAPGLCLFLGGKERAARIRVYGNTDGQCYTRGNIIGDPFAEISLQATWPESRKCRTALHELLHALGFGHEQQRRDGKRFLDFHTEDLDEYWRHQYQPGGVTGINRFDPHSVMMYSLDEHLKARRGTGNDVVWTTKDDDDQCQVLSELDKVGLNMLYRPCYTDEYNPKLSEITGLYYCGRPMFASAEKDIVKEAFTDGNCGPDNWANCAACRVLSTPKSKEIHDLNKWQGWTGLVYCGRYFGKVVRSGHDGYCGPDNGPPCGECGKLLDPGCVKGPWCRNEQLTVPWEMAGGDYICNPGLVFLGQDPSLAYRDILGRAKGAGHLSPNMETALLQLQATADGPYDPRVGCAKFYRVQSNQWIGQQADRVQVPVALFEGLDPTWNAHFLNAMKDINQAVPGLYLFQCATEPFARIKVYGNTNQGCYAKGNIIVLNSAVISLQATWDEARMSGTALHELMHALGFGHEYQAGGITGMNGFDPHSVMMYPLGEQLKARRGTGNDIVGASKADDDQCQVLSELDKVGLNMLYRPCYTDQYNPKLSEITGLYYCGRPMFASAEQISFKKAFTDGKCGPRKWANCAACRVLSTQKSKDLSVQDRWQGWTGLVYCGKKFRKVNNDHDGYCGPDFGPSCPACSKLLIPGLLRYRRRPPAPRRHGKSSVCTIL